MCYQTVAAQDSSRVSFSGYAELYYGFDFASPANHERPFFTYNHKRHNEVNLNLAYAKASYNHHKVRANLAMMAGNYAQYNLANEPNLLQLVYEANMGVKLSNTKNIWLDVGIMPSHIGFESAISADCWTLSRSMVAENSPYFETGAKITITNQNSNFFTSFLVLNGWQRIQRPDGINRPSFGMQLNYKPAAHITLNYSNFLGTDKPDSLKSWRMYHNFYMVYEPLKKWGLIAGFDIGTESQNKQLATWFTPVVILKYIATTKSALAMRVEYFSDKKQVLMPIPVNTWGFSLNYDYRILDNVLWRIEAKNYQAQDKIFGQNTSKINWALLTSLSIKL